MSVGILRFKDRCVKDYKVGDTVRALKNIYLFQEKNDVMVGEEGTVQSINGYLVRLDFSGKEVFVAFLDEFDNTFEVMS